MNDIVGAELKEGDVVAFRKPKYSGLVVGKIIKVSRKQVRVQYRNNWNYPDDDGNYPDGKIQDTVYYPYDVCKIHGEDAIAFILRNEI